jgi:E3 ubiquitin-protein ligase RFWD3
MEEWIVCVYIYIDVCFSCIQHWLTGGNKRCPQCNARAKRSHIRRLFATSLVAVDSSEKDHAIQVQPDTIKHLVLLSYLQYIMSRNYKLKEKQDTRLRKDMQRLCWTVKWLKWK